MSDRIYKKAAIEFARRYAELLEVHARVHVFKTKQEMDDLERVLDQVRAWIEKNEA